MVNFRLFSKYFINYVACIIICFEMYIANINNNILLLSFCSRMKAVIILLTLACVMVAVYGIACTKEICESAKCDQTVTLASCSTPSMEYRPRGGFCGCCPICVKLLGKSSTYSKITMQVV